MRKQISL